MNKSTIDLSLKFEHSYAERLPDFYASVSPTPVREPRLLQFNESLAGELGFYPEQLSEQVVRRVFSGNELPHDARPIAQAYAGHQFGSFVPQLGDGRALLIGEVIDQQGTRRDIALKGSGRTPFSRGGDGKAAVGPVLREYLIGEAMHAMGIPTTRALAAVATGEPVIRDRPLPGAILTRVAASHVRVGTFQYFAARGQIDQLRKLADYVIERHYPELKEDNNRHQSLLRGVMERQAALVAQWMLVGFIHGVMNTDNMTISGETIDYGPCAFMESYNPNTVFSSIDHAGRYAYGNQPTVALWNLARFAETLLPLFDEEDTERAIADATAILDTFMPTFEEQWYKGARTKLGLADPNALEGVSEAERGLMDDWIELLTTNEADHTLAWRNLAAAAEGNSHELSALFASPSEVDLWLTRWRGLWRNAAPEELASVLRKANPRYIPRNHLVEEALAAASDHDDLTPFEKLLDVVQNPFEERPQWERYADPAPAKFTAEYQTFCGT